jgi:hypothetical protein
MTKTQIVILWGAALVVVLVFVLLSRFISRPLQESEPLQAPQVQSYNLADIPQSARRFYPRAEQAAKSWQEDAALVSAAASWPFVRLDDLSLPADWTFQFFSPALQKIFVVNVSETQVAVMRESLSPYPLPVLPLDEWQVDSVQALNAWLNHGGGGFLKAHPIVDVNARLRRSKEGRAQWIVVGVVRSSETVHVVWVDAISGEASLP